MSIQSAPYYWVDCDSCGKKADYGGEYSAWADAGQAVDMAVDSEWHVGRYHTDEPDTERHHCPDCEWFCDECELPAGKLSGERDYLCQACWDKAKAAEVSS